MHKIITEESSILEVMKAARSIQELLWWDLNSEIGLEEFKRMFWKRLAKIDEIDMSNSHWKTELRKRVLQTAAISVNLMTKLDNNLITHGGIHPTMPSNLPEFEVAEKRRGRD